MFFGSIPHFLPSFVNVQSPGAFPWCAAIASRESRCGCKRAMITESSRWLCERGTPITGPGGSQSRGSENDGVMPLSAPPAPTLGPVPCPPVGDDACDGALGIVVGVVEGATNGLACVRYFGMLLPPFRPWRVTPSLGTWKYPIFSTGTSL